ncbi:hypothetical protein NEIELOOT_00586 [Neisseria elongata subsp. glycolytica ATCC 29315]|uniref:Uncharacterized protein n=1 Tax=Neisseria elongata subsp. glycolytica ATCC 29315 TaxID=546263 RepID=D4DNB8_NEIEG|nr:hypothetical protein NEIELOOT_00586 [Neisseria elongata subsp. glycolytica ATCC 29315]
MKWAALYPFRPSFFSRKYPLLLKCRPTGKTDDTKCFNTQGRT